MAKVIKITDDGLKKLEEELEYLKTEGRADIAEKIKVAAATVIFPRTANTMRPKTNRQRSKQELSKSKQCLKMLK